MLGCSRSMTMFHKHIWLIYLKPVLDSPNEITIGTEEMGANTPDNASEVPQQPSNTDIVEIPHHQSNFLQNKLRY